MFAGDLAFLLQSLKVLPDRSLRNLESDRKLPDPGASFLLNPVKNPATTRLGQQAGDGFRPAGIGFRFQHVVPRNKGVRTRA